MVKYVLKEVNARGARRVNTNFNNYEFNSCNYRDSSYHNCVITRQKIENSDFKHVHFSECPINDFKVEKSCMTWGLFLDSDINVGFFKDANMFLSTFTDSGLKKVMGFRSNFGLSSFKSLIIENCTFAECDFRGASFDSVLFNNVTFTRCRLDNVSFKECLFYDTKASDGTCDPMLLLVKEDDREHGQTMNSSGVSGRVIKFFYDEKSFDSARMLSLAAAGRKFGKEDPGLAKELTCLFDKSGGVSPDLLSGVSPDLLSTAKKVENFVAEANSGNTQPKVGTGFVDSKTDELYIDEYGDYYSRAYGSHKETPKRAYLFCSEGIPEVSLEETR